MPKKSEEGLSGLLNKKYSKLPESLIATYGFVEENEKVNAAIADDDGRSILTQHIVKVSTTLLPYTCRVLLLNRNIRFFVESRKILET